MKVIPKSAKFEQQNVSTIFYFFPQKSCWEHCDLPLLLMTREFFSDWLYCSEECAEHVNFMQFSLLLT